MMDICFRLDCSSEVGIGHLRRCTTLSTWFPDANISFLIKGKISKTLEGLFEGSDWAMIDPVYSLCEENAHWKGKNFDLIFFDFTTFLTFERAAEIEDYFKYRKMQSKELILIDGLFSDSLINLNQKILSKVTGVIIPYWGAEPIKNFSGSQFVGGEYFVYEKKYLEEEWGESEREDITNVLITMGGSDPWGGTEWLLAEFAKNKGALHKTRLKVVVGPSFTTTHIEKILDIQNEIEFEILENLLDLFPLYNWSDVVFTTVGLTRYEASRLGVPLAILINDAKQRVLNKPFDELGISFSFEKRELNAYDLNNTIFNKSIRDKFKDKMNGIIKKSNSGFSEMIKQLGGTCE